MEDEDEPTKRQRPVETPTAPPAAPPTAWPSASTLYAQGLEQRAEAVGTTGDKSWTINAAEWRASGFDAADTNSTTLKQRQQEARRAMLRR